MISSLDHQSITIYMIATLCYLIRQDRKFEHKLLGTIFYSHCNSKILNLHNISKKFILSSSLIN